MTNGIEIGDEEIFVEDGFSVVLERGKEYRVNGKLSLRYTDNRGAGAAVFLEDPVSGEVRQFPPNLAWAADKMDLSDLRTYATEYVRELADRFHRLRSLSEDELKKGSKETDFLGLSRIFKPVDYRE